MFDDSVVLRMRFLPKYMINYLSYTYSCALYTRWMYGLFRNPFCLKRSRREDLQTTSSSLYLFAIGITLSYVLI